MDTLGHRSQKLRGSEGLASGLPLNLVLGGLTSVQGPFSSPSIPLGSTMGDK